jgi:hypothetical protein
METERRGERDVSMWRSAVALRRSLLRRRSERYCLHAPLRLDMHRATSRPKRGRVRHLFASLCGPPRCREHSGPAMDIWGVGARRASCGGGCLVCDAYTTTTAKMVCEWHLKTRLGQPGSSHCG